MRRALALTLSLAACTHAPPTAPITPSAAGDDREQELFDAATRGEVDRVRALLDRGADIDARFSNGTTVLHWAVFADSPSEIHDYYEGLGKPHDTYWTPKPDAPMTALLIARGAKVDAVDAKGETPLHQAVIGAALPAARALLAAGANPMLRDRKGRTPLDVARERAAQPDNWTPHVPDERQKILQLLERAAAPPECAADADCTISSAPRSCDQPCGACPTAVPHRRAENSASGRHQSLSEMQLVCPDVLQATCSPCPAPPELGRARCVAGRCQ